MNKIEKNKKMKTYEKNILKNLKKYQKISQNLKISQKISKNLKISQNISKCLKMSLTLFFKRGFARLGSVLHIFLDHRKSQNISNLLEKKRKKQNKTNATLQQLC